MVCCDQVSEVICYKFNWSLRLIFFGHVVTLHWTNCWAIWVVFLTTYKIQYFSEVHIFLNFFPFLIFCDSFHHIKSIETVFACQLAQTAKLLVKAWHHQLQQQLLTRYNFTSLSGFNQHILWAANNAGYVCNYIKVIKWTVLTVMIHLKIST